MQPFLVSTSSYILYPVQKRWRHLTDAKSSYKELFNLPTTHLFFYFVTIFCIARALSKFPSTFNFPDVNATTGLSFPSAIFVKTFAVAINTASLS